MSVFLIPVLQNICYLIVAKGWSLKLIWRGVSLSAMRKVLLDKIIWHDFCLSMFILKCVIRLTQVVVCLPIDTFALDFLYVWLLFLTSCNKVEGLISFKISRNNLLWFGFFILKRVVKCSSGNKTDVENVTKKKYALTHKDTYLTLYWALTLVNISRHLNQYNLKKNHYYIFQHCK